MKKKVVNLVHKNGIKRAGAGSNTLVSVLVGATSKKDYSNQLKKLDCLGNLSKSDLPDIISDLSLQNSSTSLYTYLIEHFPDLVISTLPIYQCKQRSGFVDSNELLDITVQQLEAGVSFITIHPTANQELVRLSLSRLVPCTSRGGAMVVKDLANRNFNAENVYLRIIDEIIATAKKYRAAISLGATFRSANIFDSVDSCQIGEFKVQKEIADYIYNRGVDVIVEGPGHTPPNKIQQVARYYNKMSYPVMPLGPIPTDVAIGQDHISSSIGSVLLGMHQCADIITSVTREEHTGGVPSIEATIEAIKAARIAAHIIDINKLGDSSADKKIVAYRQEHHTCVYGKKNAGCSRCAEVCPLKVDVFLSD